MSSEHQQQLREAAARVTAFLDGREQIESGMHPQDIIGVVAEGEIRKLLVDDLRLLCRHAAPKPLPEMLEQPDDGWGVIRPGDRRAHYYKGHRSLCGKIGLYFGPKEPDEAVSKDDCVACRRKLGPPSEKVEEESSGS